MTPLDWAVFISVLLVTFAVVIYGHVLKKKQVKSDGEDHFLDLLLMGRKLTLPLFIATLVATWYGGIFGVTRIAFDHGIFNFITQGLFWYIAYLIFAFFLVNKVAQYQALTLPHLVGQMFGPKSAYLSAIFNFFNVLPISYIISIGLLIQLLFSFSLLSSMTIGLLLVMSYSLLGGFRAVVFSDLVQFVVMCSSVLLGLLFSIKTFGGLDFLTLNLPATHFSLTSDQGLALTFVWGFIALATLVDPNFYQRCFAAQNPLVAKRGIIIATAIWFCFDICTTFGAMYARAVIPEADSASAYLVYMLQLLPAGLRGFFLAGILATILSTLDSYLFLAGATLGHDLAPQKLKKRPFMFHLGVLSAGLIALLMALLFEGNIKMVWRVLGSYSAACLLLPIMVGYIFPGKIKDWQFITACLGSVLTTTAWRILERPEALAHIDALYIGIFTTFIILLPCVLFTRNSEQLNIR